MLKPIQVAWLSAVLGVTAGCSRPVAPERPRPRWSQEPYEFAVGVAAVDSPLVLSNAVAALAAPTLAAADITDVPASFVADPFLVRTNGMWYLFVEVLNAASDQGDIAVAESRDLRGWRYAGIVIDEPFHMSYPRVFAWEGRHYMTPETAAGGGVFLYEATAFPTQWVRRAQLLQGPWKDPTVFRRGGRWWMWAGGEHDRVLHLFGADALAGPWTEHPLSPVVRRNANIARPGGFIEDPARLYRATQDCKPRYGNALRVFEVSELTPEAYREEECPGSPVLSAGMAPWAPGGMHQLSAWPAGDAAGGWVVAVDGYDYAQPEAWLDAPFDSGAALRGVTRRPREVQAGGRVLLRFFWEGVDPALASGPKAAFVHVVRGRRTVFQADYTLARGRGVYEVVASVPADAPAGVYAIECGLFRPGARGREPLRGGLPGFRRRSVTLPVTLTVVGR